MEAQWTVGALSEAGIEAIVLPVRTEGGYAVSAGVFGQMANVDRMVQRLQGLDYRNLRVAALGEATSARNNGRAVPLSAASDMQASADSGQQPVNLSRASETLAAAPDPAPQSLPSAAPDATPTRLIISGAPADAAGDALQLGPPPEPVPSAEPAQPLDTGARVKLDKFLAEAGFLPRSGARADGSPICTAARRWSGRSRSAGRPASPGALMATSRPATTTIRRSISLTATVSCATAYSAEAGHPFRVKRAGHSTRSRPPVPGMPATLASERSDAG